MTSNPSTPTARRGELSPDIDAVASLHPSTSAERWAEESPAYRAPVEYQAAAEDDFWRANHQSQSYAGETSYGYFAPAYRAGYEGYAKHGIEGSTFEEAEPLLRQQYEQHGGKLEWTAARLGAQAAWNRLAERRIGSATPSPPKEIT